MKAVGSVGGRFNFQGHSKQRVDVESVKYDGVSPALRSGHSERRRVISVTVITATLNASRTIADLCGDLISQTDSEFQWILVDGGSTDGTLSLVPEELRSRVHVVQEPDFGIYDALNKGIRKCGTSHYLVIGADDRLDAGAISRFKHLAAEDDADIVSASVRDDGGIALPDRGKAWLRGQNAYIGHHSVGTLIRTSLHDKFGLYTSRLPLAADQLFVKTAIRAGSRVRYAPDFVAGEFSRTGVSSTQFLQCLFEFTLVQMQTERHRWFQLAIFIARLIRHWKKAVSN